MTQAYTAIRSLVLWGLSFAHFAVSVVIVLALRPVFGQRSIDPVLRRLCRNIVWLAGGTCEARFSPRFDRERTCIFMSNHVNLFDPFVLYCAIPQYARGLELQSHFKLPFYGWLMERFGNIPVPDAKGMAGLRRAFRMTKEHLDSGMSVVGFPEGRRTLDGRVGKFNDGVFVMARQFKYPIVPISIVGSFALKRKNDWRLRPAHIVVHFHDPIETDGLTRTNLGPLRDEVHRIVSAPVNKWLDGDEPA